MDKKKFRFISLKMPRNPGFDSEIPGMIIILSDRDSLAEKDPKNNAEKLLQGLLCSIAHEELVELKRLLPES